jgi:hypothetical protein
MHLDAIYEARLALLSSAPLDKWIALSADESRIVAVADTFAEATEAAEQAGEADPLLIHIPSDWTSRVL